VSRNPFPVSRCCFTDSRTESTPAKSQASIRTGTSSTAVDTPSRNPRFSAASSTRRTRGQYRDESPTPNRGDNSPNDDDVIFSGANPIPVESGPDVAAVDDDNDALSDPDSDMDDATKALIEEVRARQIAEEALEETGDIRILVESRIPGAAEAINKTLKGKPFRCRVLYRGELKKVKQSWCNTVRNGGVDIEDTDVIMMWRDNLLYKSTTPQSLGIRFIGSLLYAGDKSDLSGFTTSRTEMVIHMWTEESQKQFLEEKEKERQREFGEICEPKERTPSPEPEAKVRVTVRSKQGDPVKVLVPASGTVGDLVATFRSKRNIPEDAKITIVLDGEALQDHMSLQDAEVDDDIQVDAKFG
jgi:hypothetical protein